MVSGVGLYLILLSSTFCLIADSYQMTCLGQIQLILHKVRAKPWMILQNWADQIPVQCSSRLRFTVYKEIV